MTLHQTLRVGITGANGFIGAHLTRSAVFRKFRPILFLERGSSVDTLADMEGLYEPVFGDVLDPSSLNAFTRRCDVVFHLAGLNRYWAPDPSVFRKVNVLGVRNVAEACFQNGVSKLVHVSSCIALGASERPVMRNEESPFNLKHLNFLYAETKNEGEAEIARWYHRKGLPAVVVNPASAIGENDHGPTPIGKPIADIAAGKWPVYVAGGACFVDIHDLIRGLWLALEKGRPGERYLLVGENITNREFMTRVARAAGVPKPRFRVPKSFLDAAARVYQWTADNVTKKHPPLTPGMSALIGKFMYFSGEKAKTELGFQAGSVDAAIERSVRWYRANA